MNLFRGLRPLQRAGAARDMLAGVVLAAMDIPQVLGYAKIAGMPVVTGLYTLLLPLLAFAAFGSSRSLVVAADSATAANAGLLAQLRVARVHRLPWLGARFSLATVRARPDVHPVLAALLGRKS